MEQLFRIKRKGYLQSENQTKKVGDICQQTNEINGIKLTNYF